MLRFCYSQIVTFETVNDTIQKCKSNDRLKKSIADSKAAQKIYREDEKLPQIDKSKNKGPAKIFITKNRTFQAANPEFKRCMEKHPRKGFTEWKKIQNNEKEIEKIKKADTGLKLG